MLEILFKFGRNFGNDFLNLYIKRKYEINFRISKNLQSCATDPITCVRLYRVLNNSNSLKIFAGFQNMYFD